MSRALAVLLIVSFAARALAQSPPRAAPAFTPQLGSPGYRHLAWSPDGTVLAAYGSDERVRIWRPEAGAIIATLALATGRDTCSDDRWLQWAADASRLVVGGGCGSVEVWDAALWTRRASLPMGASPKVASPDGAFVAFPRTVPAPADSPCPFSPRPSELAIWDTRTGRVVRTLPPFLHSISALAWSPDASRLVSGQGDSLRIWDVQAATVKDLGETHDMWVVGWSPDGGRIASMGYDHSLTLWDAASGRVQARLRRDDRQPRGLAWSPRGDLLAIWGESRSVEVWDAQRARRLATPPDRAERPAWSPDGRTLAAMTPDGQLLWDARSGRLAHRLPGSAHWLQALAWRPDGRAIAVADSGPAISIWDARTGAERRRLQGWESDTTIAAWRPDGQGFAVGGKDDVTAWRLAGPSLQTKLGTGRVDELRWRPDGAVLASLQSGTPVRLWHQVTGAAVPTPPDTFALAWSPDGRWAPARARPASPPPAP